VDTVFRELELDRLPDGVTSSVHRRQDGEVDFFQHFNKFTQPYSYEQTRRTMWKLTKLQHRQDPVHPAALVQRPSKCLSSVAERRWHKL
jgi:hypothetical protein